MAAGDRECRLLRRSIRRRRECAGSSSSGSVSTGMPTRPARRAASAHGVDVGERVGRGDAPKSNGSSTIGMKKSVVATIACVSLSGRPRRRRDVSMPTSSAVGIGSRTALPRICCRTPGAIAAAAAAVGELREPDRWTLGSVHRDWDARRDDGRRR